MRYLISRECFWNCHDECKHVLQTINIDINCTALKIKCPGNNYGKQICLSDKLYKNYSYEAVHHFPAYNSKIIYVCLGFFQSRFSVCGPFTVQRLIHMQKQERSIPSAALSPEMQQLPIESLLWWCLGVFGGFAMLLRSFSDIIILDCE